MKVVTAAQMRDIDRRTIEEMGCPGEVLMGLAGRAVADEVLKRFPYTKRVAVFAGTGNNGGDGFVSAYFLHNSGVDVHIWVAGDPDRYTSSTAVYARLCGASGIPVKPVVSDSCSIDLGDVDVIVDALLGTGLAAAPRGIAATLISIINRSSIPVVAADIPSGLPSDGAAPAGEAVRATYTVTMGLPKLSLVTWPGKDFCGDVTVADIGFPRSLTDDESLVMELGDMSYVQRHLPPVLHGDTHKGERGHLLLVGGFDGMEGAILMAARAALAAGTGLISLLTTVKAREIVAGLVPELMTIPLEPAVAEDPSRLLDVLSGRRYDAIVLGPGMGRTPLAASVFNSFMKIIPSMGAGRVLVDGDGLFHAACYLAGETFPSGLNTVLTPHFMEASRLMDEPIDVIKADRPAAAYRCSGRTGAVVLLKGPGTMVTDGNRMIINTTGNPSMATGGSGDVLSGIIGAFLATGMETMEAAALGAWIHGSAGDMAASATGIISATDIIGRIREALSLCRVD